MEMKNGCGLPGAGFIRFPLPEILPRPRRRPLFGALLKFFALKFYSFKLV